MEMSLGSSAPTCVLNPCLNCTAKVENECGCDRGNYW
jgi:hypothetical protein